MLKHKKKGRKEKVETNTERRERKTDRRKKDRKKERKKKEKKETQTERNKEERKKERKKEHNYLSLTVHVKTVLHQFLCNLWIFHTDTFGYDGSHRYKKFGNFQMVTYNEGRKCFIE